MRLSSAVVAVSLCGVALAPEAQQTRLLRSGTQEALLDLRTAATLAWRWRRQEQTHYPDKNERFIRDLKAEDVQVIENGTLRQSKAFRWWAGRTSGRAFRQPCTRKSRAGYRASLISGLTVAWYPASCIREYY